MTFTGLNYLAIVIAAVVAWVAGAAWYMSLSKVWMAAQELTPEKVHENKSKLPFIYSFVAELVMAWVLAGLMAHFGAAQVTVLNGIISGAFCWLGFVLTTLLVNTSFAMRDMRLIWIDGGHWLIVLLLMGAIIGLMGV
jgi:Protein of unknown function (DUF1761)